MKLYFFGPVYTGDVITNVIEREYINDSVSGQFTTSQINESGLVKEVKHYEPAFSAVSNAVSNSTTVTFATTINTKTPARIVLTNLYGANVFIFFFLLVI